MPHLRLASGNGPAEWFPLQGERVVVGRSRDCDLILPDVLLSRRHVELVRSAEGWLVRDLGSLNGTRLNGARVENEALLRNGDVVEIADWSLAYRESELPSGLNFPTLPQVDTGPRRPAPGDEARAFAAEFGIKRNDPCPCGSGQKFKKCCGSKGEEAGAATA